MVYATSTTSKRQGRTTRLYSSYTQGVDGVVDNSYFGVWVVDKLGWVEKEQTFAHALPKPRTPVLL